MEEEKATITYFINNYSFPELADNAKIEEKFYAVATGVFTYQVGGVNKSVYGFEKLSYTAEELYKGLYFINKNTDLKTVGL